jgi:hypothetical protein
MAAKDAEIVAEKACSIVDIATETGKWIAGRVADLERTEKARMQEPAQHVADLERKDARSAMKEEQKNARHAVAKDLQSATFAMVKEE